MVVSNRTTVYLIESLSKPGVVYTGLTGDFQRRLEEHNDGRNISTKAHLPWKSRVTIQFDDPQKAQDFESYLKSGSGKAFRNRHF